jgi:membrane-bound lytic murein transglycosylase B
MARKQWVGLREMRRKQRAVFLACLTALCAAPSATGQDVQARYQVWRAKFVAEAREAGFDSRIIDGVVPREPNRQVLAYVADVDALRRPFADYLFVNAGKTRVVAGQKLLAEHAVLFGKIEKAFAVDRNAVVAVWGMESSYGAASLAYRAPEAVATHAFANAARRDYFEDELFALLRAYRSGQPVGAWPSSADGGLGQPQFMPSNLELYGVDFDNDGSVDIWNSVPDTLASIARYLQAKGWKFSDPIQDQARPIGPTQKADASVSFPASDLAKRGFETPAGIDSVTRVRAYQPERDVRAYVLTYPNFEVLWNYNGARWYAVAAGLLAEQLGCSMACGTKWPRADWALSVLETHRLQVALTALGYAPGKADGVYGRQTWAAVRSFLADRGKESEAYPSRSTYLEAIRAANAGASQLAPLQVIHFESDECEACPALKSALTEQFGPASGVTITAVDVAVRPEIAAGYGATAAPTLVVLRGAREVARLKGPWTPSVLAAALAAASNGDVTGPAGAPRSP